MGSWIGDAVCGTFDVFEGVARVAELVVQAVDGADDEKDGEGVGGWIGKGGLFQVGGGEEGDLSDESDGMRDCAAVRFETILDSSSASRVMV